MLPELILVSSQFANLHRLEYNESAKKWVEALPLGNGRIGAMVFGGLSQERIALNDATLWSGEPKEWDNPNAKLHLPKLREALFKEDWEEAKKLAQLSQGTFSQSYLPLGDLHLKFANESSKEGYRRILDLETAVHRVHNSAGLERWSFVSHPDQVMVIRLSDPNEVDVRIELTSLLKGKAFQIDGRTIGFGGQAPVHVDPNYISSKDPIRYRDNHGTRYQFAVRAIDGDVAFQDNTLRVSGVKQTTLILSAATSFAGFNQSPSQPGLDEKKLCLDRLNKASKKPFKELLRRHVEDHQKLYSRCSLQLPSVQNSGDTTVDRLQSFPTNQDPSLAALVFHYGRYLMIAGSRKGGQPLNLQGIWNDHLRAPWSSNYTLNINAQMNYWPAETTNLSECHLPLIEMTKELSVTGGKTAQTMYGMPGWCAHHNSDIWRMSCPVGDLSGDPIWANWNMGGTWLASHLWEHYQFNQDAKYLSDVYPTLKGAAEFCLAWLTEDRRKNSEPGRLTTAPSTSPETGFYDYNKKYSGIGTGAAMDLALIREVFQNTISAARKLKKNPEFVGKLEEASKKLIPFQVGARGQLQEWADDFVETDVHHRHVSHLYGTYPANIYTGQIRDAARKSLEIRGDDATGWGMGWRLCLWARFGEPDRCQGMIKRLLKLVEDKPNTWNGGGIYPNLFDAHPPFQIDGNFGYTAGVAEMLIQSHEGVVQFLPALPATWKDGKARGLKARGNFEIDLDWENGKLKEFKVKANTAGKFKFQIGSGVNEISIRRGESKVFKF